MSERTANTKFPSGQALFDAIAKNGQSVDTFTLEALARKKIEDFINIVAEYYAIEPKIAHTIQELAALHPHCYDSRYSYYTIRREIDSRETYIKSMIDNASLASALLSCVRTVGLDDSHSFQLRNRPANIRYDTTESPLERQRINTNNADQLKKLLAERREARSRGEILQPVSFTIMR